MTDVWELLQDSPSALTGSVERGRYRPPVRLAQTFAQVSVL